MRRHALAVSLAVALVFLAVFLRNREPLPETPEEAVTALFDAAEAGDTDRYLSLVGEAIQRSLRQTRDELGPDAVTEELRATTQGLKGIAVTRRAEPSENAVELEVELVFSDRNERQRVRTRRARSGWIVETIERADRIKPEIPYGTPVFEAEEVNGPRSTVDR